MISTNRDRRTRLRTSLTRAGAAAVTAVSVSVVLGPPTVATASPGVVNPGAEIEFEYPDGHTTTCTAGFLVVTSDGTPAFLTAGHCVPVTGGKVYLAEGGQEVPIGTSRVVTLTGSNTGDTDIALVDMNGSQVLKSPTLANGISVTGISGGQELRTSRPQLCKVGQVSGTTCGPISGFIGDKVLFEAGSEHGDSGSPVVAFWPDGSYTAVGVLNGSPKDNEGIAIAQMIAPWTSRWALQLVN